MAYIIPSKFPIDTLPDVAVGVSVPFMGRAVFNQTYITKDQIKSNLINFFLTNQGERYFNPNFGGNLRKFLFEAIAQNNLDNLKTEISQKLKTIIPSISVQYVDIVSYPDSNQISISLGYQVLNQSSEEIQINFNNDDL